MRRTAQRIQRDHVFLSSNLAFLRSHPSVNISARKSQHIHPNPANVPIPHSKRLKNAPP